MRIAYLLGFFADQSPTGSAALETGMSDVKSFLIGTAGSIVAAILLILLGGFFSQKARSAFTSLFGRFLDVDIEYVFKNKTEAEPDIERELGKATFVYLLSGRGNDLQRNAFLSALNQRPRGRLTEFKILLPSIQPRQGNPCWVEQREQELASFDSAFGSGILKKQIATTIDFFKSYVTSGDIELRFFECPHIGRVLITDRCVYLTPYAKDAHARTSRIIKHRRGGEMYDMLLRLFNQLWAVSTGPTSPGQQPTGTSAA